MCNTLVRANEILGTNYGDWVWLSKHEGLTEDFIRKFADKVEWEWISQYQHLSEGFIREFKDKVDWLCISRYQRLSENFIRKFANDINIFFIRNIITTV